MVIINSEGKINDNYYIIDGMTMGMPKFLSIYIIENNGKRLMIDVGEALKTRKIVKKLKELNLFPVDIIILTHSHWDHAQGIKKMHEAMNNPNLEIFASENAIENIKSPERMIEGYQGVSEVYPFEEVKPLKEGDVIDLNGLELEILNMFGHTLDSIAIFDKTNKTLFAGDSIIMRLDAEAFFIPLMPPDFHEEELLKTFNRLREMKDNLNSIAFAHFGIWKDDHFSQILEEMEDSYFKVKAALIKWYNENLSMDDIASEYVKTFMPDSKFWNEKIFLFIIDMMISGLRTSEFIK